MHSKIQQLRAERNTVMTRMHGSLSGNASLLESKVKQVSARLSSEVAEMQEQVESLTTNVSDLKSKNKQLAKENTQLRKENNLMEEEKNRAAAKKVTFSATCAPPTTSVMNASFSGADQFPDIFQGGLEQVDKNISDPSPASSVTSASSAFIDPEVAAQVSRAIEWARKRKAGSSEDSI